MVLEANLASVHAISLFVVLLCICILIGHLLEKTRWISSTIIDLVIGFSTGAIILYLSKGTSSLLFKFDEQLFFNYVLPPIIFNAGFKVEKKQFFHNFTTIMLLGAIGTLISFIVISQGAQQLFKHLDVGFLDFGDFLAIGVIFAATDSVSILQVLKQEETPLVYSLVFGESVVNDATSVVLFNVIQKFKLTTTVVGSTVARQFVGDLVYLFVASTFLGVIIGLVCAYVTKKMCFGRHSSDREIAVMFLMAYLSYMMAILFNLSGILSSFVCGIIMSHYAWHNVTANSRVSIKHGIAAMSFVAETFIFLYVGMDALDVERWRFVLHSLGTCVRVSASLLGLVLVSRAAFVFPLSFLASLTRRGAAEKIGFRHQILIWWAGLIRGSVSLALAYHQFTTSALTQKRENAMLITSTITVVIFSTLVFGMLTKPLVWVLLPSSRKVDNNNESPEPTTSMTTLLGDLGLPLFSNGKDSKVNMTCNLARRSILRTFITTPSSTIHFYWRKFDNSVMRPVFGGNPVR
ncbi:sodium/hydrogen exchanger 1-like [Spinacia oleracea]|uniref:Sodium/hydrogen exchanger 1-like n=1 Tax=Spinacia oleracea TaxID=3562 RepID=A0A9R0JFE9_SPIOL|nr:sodium/hydrogen exchanger 1-like [Spinacia oleracea]